MKEKTNTNCDIKYIVAPLVGAWIESSSAFGFSTTQEVAPLVGAWIERLSDITGFCKCNVAPLVGAWIERRETLKERN